MKRPITERKKSARLGGRGATRAGCARKMHISGCYAPPCSKPND